MNPLHYPSLELCKKLTEVGFPIVDTYRNSYGVYSRREEGFAKIPTDYTCPSVMDMLDVMPELIHLSSGNNNKPLRIYGKTTVSYHITFDAPVVEFKSDIFPNALAEMILWLVENKHLSFNK